MEIITAPDYYTLLLVVWTFISYVLLHRFTLTLGSLTCFSGASVFVITLMTQVQTVSMYYLFNSTPDMRYGNLTPPFYRDWFYISQILVQWACTLFAMFIYLPSASISPTTKNVLPWGFHGFFLIFYVSAGSGGQWQEIVSNINENFDFGIINPLFIFVTVVALFLQALIMPPADETITLSEWEISIQLFTFLLLTTSWPLKLIRPHALWKPGPQSAIFMGWYPWMAWACANTAILVVGQGIMLLLRVRRRRFNGNIRTAEKHKFPICPAEV
ncbi:hypothetical protein BOTCAL_0899g00010 [Botryotinia calthae]|uniref:Uncharacterized protein n=1 Tax=Botryotinia calthae TaxID=38488 RepID=A0A4Y8CHQ6_9HELO|nr:hypothetical protein BOTCAL_0899g00010 [Botryotinia calthae]